MRKIIMSLLLFLLIAFCYFLYDYSVIKKLEHEMPQIRSKEIRKIAGTIASPKEFQSIVQNGAGFLRIKIVCSGKIFEKMIASPVFPQNFEMLINDNCPSILFEAGYSNFDFHNFKNPLMPLAIFYQIPIYLLNNIGEVVNLGEHYLTTKLPVSVKKPVTIPEFISSGCQGVKGETEISGFYKFSSALSKRFDKVQNNDDLNIIFYGVEFIEDTKSRVLVPAGATKIKKQFPGRKEPFRLIINKPYSLYVAVIIPGGMPGTNSEPSTRFLQAYGSSIVPMGYTRSFNQISCMHHKDVEVIFMDPVERTDSILVELRKPFN